MALAGSLRLGWAIRLEDLTPEQREKAHSCKTTDDLIELARSEGAELTGDQLEAVAGGVWVCSCDGANTCESKEICVGHGRGI